MANFKNQFITPVFGLNESDANYALIVVTLRKGINHVSFASKY